MFGLVLTAGGARGAYQAGVLQRIGEIPAFRGRPSPFPIITGASAGAINGTMLATGNGDFPEVTRRLSRLWSELRMTDIFRTDAMSLGAGGVRLLKDLTLGGFLGGGAAQSLLDATPLRGFLERHLPLGGIGESIRAGHLYAVAVSATSYHSGKSFTFIQGRRGHPVLFASRLFEELLEAPLDQGARWVVHRHVAELELVEVDEEGILWDIDRPEDYQALQSRWPALSSKSSGPSGARS